MTTASTTAGVGIIRITAWHYATLGIITIIMAMIRLTTTTTTTTKITAITMDTATISDHLWAMAADVEIFLMTTTMAEWPAADMAMVKPTTTIP